MSAVPCVKWVMLEYLQYCHNELGIFAQHAKGVFRTFPEGTIDASDAETVNDVIGETEGDLLGNAKSSSLKLRSAQKLNIWRYKRHGVGWGNREW